MALDLLVLVVSEEVDQGTEEPGFDDQILVLREDRDVADAGGGREDEGEERGAEKAEEWGEAVELDNLELVLFCACEGVFSLAARGRKGGRTVGSEVPKSESRLALDLETGRVHQTDQVGDELGLGRCEPFAVLPCDSLVSSGFPTCVRKRVDVPSTAMLLSAVVQ